MKDYSVNFERAFRDTKTKSLPMYQTTKLLKYSFILFHGKNDETCKTFQDTK